MNNLKFNDLIEQHKKLFSRLNEFADKRYIFKNCILTIWEAFQINGWYEYFINSNIEGAKQSFYDCAMTDIYYFKIFTENVADLFSYGRDHLLITALSDDVTAINELSNIDYQLKLNGKTLVWQSEMVFQGENHIYCALINKAMNSRLEELSALINVFEEKVIPRKGNERLKLDLAFFQAIIDRDKDTIYQVIEMLCTSEHEYRNQNSWIYKDLVSQPAQGFAKIAWLNDIQVEIINPLIHNELLPIHPNPSYLDNAKELISKMTLQSSIDNFNGMKLSESEYQNLYN